MNSKILGLLAVGSMVGPISSKRTVHHLHLPRRRLHGWKSQCNPARGYDFLLVYRRILALFRYTALLH